ncbi:hypothetical protein VOLCADRAFT_99686 [Volvox carteri f. nagariensis]|uniref:Uncharacterized protein n=1 Tax=Volvox carteri f. nagariensis TaxID=3068 RepID=D8UID4_VOLCA|nr:uncharacterized protein VOLCADRAFT_99686 [Volvox carteri f. nagariensis]EFJ40509.1 hypothetical protein VOLCADRAFT_99686 [Volvox carteri f. nagariensis]|eukprot:XP_002958433.1 hypothetical protein VOLCADRAFT_99686 [Volvox carteri f. nagariensis]
MAAAAAASSLFSDNSDIVQAPTVSSSVPSISECSHRGGLTGMFKVPSLVFDIELEDNGIGAHWQEEDWEEDEVVTEIQKFVQPSTPAEARLLSDVRVACGHAKDGQDTARLVSILSALGYNCSLRTALGGGDGADCLRNLRHTFIICDTPGVSGGPPRRHIIDPQFKEQFIIAKTTARYAAILAAVPPVFVGPEEHLPLLVNFLCNEMSAAFRQLGSVLPPWRHASSMLSKWRPRKSVDEAGIAAAAAAAGSHSRRCVGAEVGGSGGGGGGGGGVAIPSYGEGGLHGSAVAQSPALGLLQPHWPLPCKPGVQQPQSQQPLHHWQQAARAQLDGSQHQRQRSGGPGRPSYEPQRVVFGGNFVPIVPSTALAS